MKEKVSKGDKDMEREINISNCEQLLNFFDNHSEIETVYIFVSHGTEYENERDEIKTADFFEEVLKYYFDHEIKMKQFREDFKEGLREDKR